MKNKLVYPSIYLAVLVALFATGCDQHTEHKSVEQKANYTCPMHPQVVQEKPGTCPVCGMDLVLFDRTGKDQSLTLDKNQVALANITTTLVGDTTISGSRKLNGRVIADPTSIQVLSSRVNGRIEKLYYKATGVRVKKGEPLFTIYSEDLSALQQEYLVAVAQKKAFPADEQFARIERAAYQKLILYGQSANQVRKMLTANKPSPYTQYAAPATGVIREIAAEEGAYINEGGVIMQLEDYGSVWIEADVYPSETSLIREGMEVSVTVPVINATQKMNISFINPDFTEATQLTKIRGKIKNENNALQPGMHAFVSLPTKGKSSAMILPAGAVIRDRNGAHVWIEVSAGNYEPRSVIIGKEDARQVEILSGIENGEKVVATGSYLLYSEFVLKKGNQPLVNHQH